MSPRGDRRQKPSKAGPENPRFPELRKRVATAPAGPGVYRWMNDTGEVVYVGKAKSLKKRLAQYVAAGKGGHGPWRQAFRLLIADFDVTVTNSELEALVLETNLIKQLKPKYNVLMKDDKNHLFVRVSVQEAYPRVELVRRYRQDGAKYFGPYLNSERIRATVELLHEALAFRACRPSLDALNRVPPAPLPTRPCLEYQIGRCNGLCAAAISQQEYRQRIDRILAFLKGEQGPVQAILRERMQVAAAERKFETAAKLRNSLQVLEGKQDDQLATDTRGEDCDAIGVSVLSNRAHVMVLIRRGGRLIGEAHHALTGQADDVAEVLEQFLPQYYDDDPDIPPMIYLPADVPGKKTLEAWLASKRGKNVRLHVPERGKQSHLLQLAEKNAREKAKLEELKWEAEVGNTEAALEGLKRLLNLPSVPKRIEGYDISHHGGTETVGSMVVMLGGKAANDHYRSFTIRTLQEGDVDDYKSLQEVLRRRLRHLKEDVPREEAGWKEQGIVIARARKTDRAALEAMRVRYPEEHLEELPAGDAALVARCGDDILGYCHMHPLSEKASELRCLWVAEGYREGALERFLLRKFLRGMKSGKVYVVVSSALENAYGQVGFRYVIKPPAAVQEHWDRMKKRMGGEELVTLVYEVSQNRADPSLTSRPDLLVIDGGKGQLSSVVEVLQASGLTIPVIGLAKREEEVFIPEQGFPVTFPAESQAKFLLMRLRDEAHRFANRHREQRLSKKTFGSALDGVPGIGPKTKADLLKHFGSVAAIKGAADASLAEMLDPDQLAALRRHL